MPQEDMLKVTLYSPDGESETVYTRWVSLVSNGTYGPPPLVAPKDGNPPLADYNEDVLYISTAVTPAFKITRIRESDIDQDY